LVVACARRKYVLTRHSPNWSHLAHVACILEIHSYSKHTCPTKHTYPTKHNEHTQRNKPKTTFMQCRTRFPCLHNHQFNSAFNESATCIHAYTHAQQRMHTCIHTYTHTRQRNILAYMHTYTVEGLHCRGFRVWGTWYMVHGTWYMVHGTW
jgi:hypothetical protein